MAKADVTEWEKAMKFANELDDRIQNSNNADLGAWVRKSNPYLVRVVYGFRVLVDNACDPKADTLEWKPEIAAAIAAYKPETVAEPSNISS